MSDEESDDYMSEDFLAKCLLYNKSDKRKHEQLKRATEANSRSSGKMHEVERREAGLRKEISEDNKGYQMLKRMGFTPGDSLGKAGSGQGLKEPIRLEVKGDRKGLGEKTKNMEKLEKSRKRKEESQRVTADPKEYRIRYQSMAALKEVERDLRMAQSACRHLDEEKGKESPSEEWFWPKVHKQRKLDPDAPSNTVVMTDDDEESDQLDVPSMLSRLTKYLRTEYSYCVWCGTSYTDQEELNSVCPGDSKDTH